ncbi:MAG: hypothetical protein CML20_05160 [Rheinheimera sp.]|uniref:hypothetical protein n=1 Tax=Arsukibacterium TaxID=336830 RepID=UPI00037CD014|nr:MULTISPECIES: hypothetical protein [Arsukibacterium]MAD74175.1 hypothetical protein [Rheinheimera sp.]
MLRTSLIFLLLVSMHSFAQGCNDSPFMSSTGQDGKKTGLFVKPNTFDGALAWEIGESDPPLPINAAVLIAQNWANGFYSRFDSVAVSSISINLVSDCAPRAGSHWVYIFSLAPVIDGNRLYGARYMVGVTMGSNIIEPEDFEN